MTSSSSSIAKLNHLELNQSGVYADPENQTNFDYSDGEQVEQRLFDILSSTSDLSSNSKTLSSQIVDWPTEYHLSPNRSNLLRGLDLTGVTRVLELGCGCGSITRYLAEQPGVTVDAVEGSGIRAALARLRCGDMDNVEISVANFNDISVPESEYDLVLFVGVTEYAGRFSDAETDEAALHDLLALGRRACSQDGVVLIAIENRLGMKYALGASEDHYALPYEGIDGYPNGSGIKTYALDEWREHIDKSQFASHRLVLPFPDYKIPNLLVPEAVQRDLSANELGSFYSRDYCKAFSMPEQETKVWDALAQSSTLAQLSNSFLWLLSDSAPRLEDIGPKTIRQFDSLEPEYLSQMVVAEEPTRREANEKEIEHLRAQITQLESHSGNLEKKVELLTNSIGWRALGWIRKLFGKTTI